MNPGETFEIQCYEYLRKTYTQKSSDFLREGGMNSFKSDIAVIRNGKIKYYIEVKDANAQSGQFVLIPDLKSKKFSFSQKKKSKPNYITEIIIKHMNTDFEHFNNAGTAGKEINVDSRIFAKWITEYYKHKNVKYFISYKNNYVIFPIRKFSEYFDVSATYRIKKSGSSAPSKKYVQSIKKIIKDTYTSSEFFTSGNKLFADIKEIVSDDKFSFGKYTYYLSKKGNDTYEVRQLSNTYNMNVIFSIHLKKSPDSNDILEFENDL